MLKFRPISSKNQWNALSKPPLLLCPIHQDNSQAKLLHILQIIAPNLVQVKNKHNITNSTEPGTSTKLALVKSFVMILGSHHLYISS